MVIVEYSKQGAVPGEVEFPDADSYSVEGHTSTVHVYEDGKQVGTVFNSNLVKTSRVISEFPVFYHAETAREYKGDLAG